MRKAGQSVETRCGQPKRPDEMRTLGILLAVAGTIALVYGGLDYTRPRGAVEMGSTSITTPEHRSFPVPAAVGVLMLVGGVVLRGERQRFYGQEPLISGLDDGFLIAPLPVFENRLAADRASTYAVGVKRRLDVVISIVALAFFMVVLALVVPAIKLDSRGPVFFPQSRIGVNRRRRISPQPPHLDRRLVNNPGRPFRIFKLRTMRLDAEALGPQLAVKGDNRMTRVGRILRKFRLDEFPQFVNVLRGEMSVVGPRPERLFFIHQFESDVPLYLERLAVLPGITGLAQVVNGYDTDLESVRRKVVLDRRYIDDLSLRTDLKILAMTFGVLWDGEG